MFDPDALIDYAGIIIGSVSLYYMLGLKRGRWHTLDHGGKLFAGGMFAFVASLVYERWAEAVEFHAWIDYHHVLMGTAMVFLALAALKSSPGKDAIEKEAIEREQAVHRLTESERRFQALAEHAPVGIFTTDAKGDCTFVNARWCEFAGMKPEEAAGKGWLKALHPDDAERVGNEWYVAAQHDKEFQSVYRFRTPSGTVHWLSGNAVSLKDAAGRVAGYVGTLSDVTEQRLAAEKLKASQAEAEAMLKNLVGREQKMIEMKEELERLRKER